LAIEFLELKVPV